MRKPLKVWKSSYFTIPESAVTMAEFDLGEQLILEQDMDLQLTEEEILEYAKEIGIDPNTEPELLWLAIEGLTVPLPPNWIACQDPVKGLYYFNSKTSESSWHHPNDKRYSQLVIQERQALVAGTAGGTGPKKEKKEKREMKKEARKTPEVLSSASRTQHSLLGNLPPLRGMTNAGRSPLPGIAPAQQKSLGSFGGLEPVETSLGGSQRYGASSLCSTRKEEKVPLTRNIHDYADDDMLDESISVSEVLSSASRTQHSLLGNLPALRGMTNTGRSPLPGIAPALALQTSLKVSGDSEDSEETSQPIYYKINTKLDSHQPRPSSPVRPLKPAKPQFQSHESSSEEDVKFRARRFIKMKKKEETFEPSSDESGPLANLRLASELLPACEVNKESKADEDSDVPSQFIFKEVDTKHFVYEEEGEEEEEEGEEEEEESDGHLLEEEELEREEEEERKLLMRDMEKRMGFLREELGREEEEERKPLMKEKERTMGILLEEQRREEEEGRKQLIWEKEKRMGILKEKLGREEDEEEKKLKDESEQRLRALQERLLSKRSEEEAKLNAESESTLKKLRESAQGERDRQQQKLREENEVTLKKEQAAERERLEAQKRQDIQRLRAEFEEELQSERRRLRRDVEENLESVKKEVKITEETREQQMAEYQGQVTNIQDAAQRDHKREMDQLREDHEREIKNIRRQCQDEEAAFKKSLLADMQKEIEHLQDSHTIKLEKLQTEVADLERKRKKLGEEVDRPIEALPQFVQEREELKQELERMKDENHQVRGLLQRAQEERDGARMEEERLRKDRDKAIEESRRAKIGEERLRNERDNAMEECQRAKMEEDRLRNERDNAVEESRIAKMERDKLIELDNEAKMEEERLRDERDEAKKESRKAKIEEDKLRYERDKAVEESRRAKMERDKAMEINTKAKMEEEMLRNERDKAMEESRKAKMERDKAMEINGKAKMEEEMLRNEKDTAIEESRRVKMEEDRLRTQRDKAMEEDRRAKVEMERLKNENDKAMEESRRAKMEEERLRTQRDKAMEEDRRVKMEEKRLSARRDKAMEESRRVKMEEEMLREEKNTAIEESRRARMDKEQLETKVAQLQAKYDLLSDRISRIEQGEAVSASPLAEPKQDGERAEKAEETAPSWDKKDSSLHVENLDNPPLSPVHENHIGTDYSLLSTSTLVMPQMHTLDARTLAPPPSVRLSESSWNAVPRGSSTGPPCFSTPINCRLRASEDHINSPYNLAFRGAAINPILSSTRRSTSAYSSYTPASEYSRNLRPTQNSVDKEGQRVQGTIASIKKWLQMHQNDTSINQVTRYQSNKKSVVQLRQDKNQITVCQY